MERRSWVSNAKLIKMTNWLTSSYKGPCNRCESAALLVFYAADFKLVNSEVWDKTFQVAVDMSSQDLHCLPCYFLFNITRTWETVVCNVCESRFGWETRKEVWVTVVVEYHFQWMARSYRGFATRDLLNAPWGCGKASARRFLLTI